MPLDFERDSLTGALASGGLDETAGTVFAWLGVTPYLSAAAIEATLAYGARVAGTHGGIASDHALDRSPLNARQQAVFDCLAARVAAANEPWKTAFIPAELAQRLRALGFSRVEDAGAKALNARYFASREDALRVGGLAHMMWADG